MDGKYVENSLRGVTVYRQLNIVGFKYIKSEARARLERFPAMSNFLFVANEGESRDISLWIYEVLGGDSPTKKVVIAGEEKTNEGK
jgi:hypothetical protein